MVPEGWLKTNFGAVTEIANGQVDPKVEPYSNMLHIGPENVVSDSGQIVDVVTCKESSLISGKYEFDENAIVYSKIRPNLNKVCRPGFKGVCSADMYPIWAKSELDIEFLLHYMIGPQFYKVAVAMSMRTGMPKINRSDLNTVPLLLPPVDEQKKIAQILSTWDQAITTTEQLLANSQQQKKALMQQLLTGKKRLLDKNGLRFIGEWKVSKLSKLFARVTTKNNGQSTNVVTMSGQHGLIRQEDFFKKTVASEILDGYFLLKQGQFAYNKSYSNGYPMGAIKRLNRYPDGVVTTLYICFELLDSDRANSDFWEHYFESGLLNKGLSQIAHEGGRAHGLLNVKPSDFFSLKVPTPSFAEQQKIAAVLSTADQEISALQQKLNALKQEKKALMQQLLTGKRRVLVS
ncbi:restriction endonuclease subunit S [Ketobacter sp. MCCC 1A13808]|uniref:restriction endonuclease subunit S n=1 Tax=Ketobacter sp. MCCC 1A13808 TaxID=2602738 RepID=UPI0012EB91F3|nr:restriction endonuclease subunit S [Ketobacter sp. MCCC 1A13808]MVF12341.1 restriction endonuclease subunit S [Ketobacter sp. MCCC 1A13808]